MNTRWKIVDGQGADVMTADSVDAAARRERKTPRQIAQREAKLLVNLEAGAAPVFAVPVKKPRRHRVRCIPLERNPFYDNVHWVQP